jgi:hypothetical protein
MSEITESLDSIPTAVAEDAPPIDALFTGDLLLNYAVHNDREDLTLAAIRKYGASVGADHIEKAINKSVLDALLANLKEKVELPNAHCKSLEVLKKLEDNENIILNKSALHRACSNIDKETLQYMLESGWKLDKVDFVLHDKILFDNLDLLGEKELLSLVGPDSERTLYRGDFLKVLKYVTQTKGKIALTEEEAVKVFLNAPLSNDEYLDAIDSAYEFDKTKLCDNLSKEVPQRSYSVKRIMRRYGKEPIVAKVRKAESKCFKNIILTGITFGGICLAIVAGAGALVFVSALEILHLPITPFTLRKKGKQFDALLANWVAKQEPSKVLDDFLHKTKKLPSLTRLMERNPYKPYSHHFIWKRVFTQEEFDKLMDAAFVKGSSK